MIQGRINLLTWFKTTGKPYFAIFRKNNTESGNTVFNNKDRENETMETAASYLDQCLSLIHNGDYFIYCCKENGSTSKGRSETFFSISVAEVLPTQAISGIGGGMDYETMMAKASEIAENKFKQLMAEQELKNLKTQMAEIQKENKELTAAAQKPWNTLVREVSPHIGSIIEQFGFKKAIGMAPQLAVSGVQHDTTLEDNQVAGNNNIEEVMSTTVNAFCDALAARYPERWINIIAQLTHTLKTSPEKIDMALKFL